MNGAYGQLAYTPTTMYIIVLWSLIWKAIALWKAARNNQRNWFIIILVLNTVGILEIIYLFRFAKTRMKLRELAFWKKDK